ncbi:RNA polymerase rpb6 [Mesorhizobium sp. AD1-1]|uniref:RNA polymerase rpb6 n=1 Tax=Mesorhizobium sp. AD1-1 TaxID=2876621 RepID=UPI001CCF3A77|nr:RNA polymerase rpb6 [Mesorhizobium sp. AD1-1]MBZ9722267.1 RNA polymerase rpb6 [Mesorhizobium sp. AD1-1]
MDPMIVLDCENTVPNRFAAAGRGPGAQPWCRASPDRQRDGAVELALREIAGNRFQPDELKPFVLAGSVPRDDRVRPGRRRELSGDEGQSLAAEPALAQGAVH